MTDLVPTPAARPRPAAPGTVRWAAFGLALAAVGYLMLTMFAIDDMLSYEGIVRDAAERAGATEQEVQDELAANDTFGIVGAVFGGVLAGVFTVLAFGVLGGRNLVRVAAVAVSGAALLCCGGFIGIGIFADATPETGFSAQVSEQSTDAITAMQGFALVSGTLLSPLGAALALLLLVLPPSNRFYKGVPDAPPAGGQLAPSMTYDPKTGAFVMPAAPPAPAPAPPAGAGPPSAWTPPPAGGTSAPADPTAPPPP